MSKKILLIENDAAFASTLARALEARGLATRVTGDGKEGLELARDSRPDAIVLCVELPKMSGYSVCQKLRKDEELKAIPLVLTSAEATEDTFEAHRKLKARADEYLLKPFAAQALLEKLSALVALPAPPAEGEELVTLDDVEELSGEIPLIPEGETVRPQDVLPEPDEDLKLLDDAFDSIAAESPPAREPAPALTGALADETPLQHDDLRGSSALLPAEDEVAPSVEIDRLGEEADRALEALEAEEPPLAETEPLQAAALLDEPVAEPPPPEPQYRVTPEPQFRAAPEAQFRAAPETQFQTTPAPGRQAPLLSSPPPFPAPDLGSLPPLRATPVPGFAPDVTAGVGAAAALTSALAEKDSEIQRLQDRVSELLIEVARGKDHVDKRDHDLALLRGAHDGLEARLRGMEADRAAREEQFRRESAEARQASERGMEAAREETRRETQARAEVEERLRQTEGALQQAQETGRQAQETATQAQEALHQAQEALRQAQEGLQQAQETARQAQEAGQQVQEALRQAEEQKARVAQALHESEELARRTGERAGHLEAEVASLRLKVEETEQTASLKAAQLADALAERDALGAKSTDLEGELQVALGLRTQLETARADLDAAHVAHEGTRAEAERRAAELSRRISELEAVNAKHEERVVKAYQKIKSDEKIREKTRKALAIALQLLDERIAAAAPKDPAEPVPRRE